MFSLLNKIWNFFRKRKLKKLNEGFRELLLGLDSELVEEFMELLLNVMSLALWVDEDYHRNIEDFKGKYLFESKDKDISIYAVFKRSPLLKYDYLKVREGEISDADITVTFKDSEALMRFLFSPRVDILGTLLRNEVAVAGNINYIFKFGFMATQLRQMVLAGV